MFGASLTNAQSNLSNEKLLFVKQKQEALMEKLIYLLFYGENMLCWSSKLTVQLLMIIPASKMANESTDTLPMSLFWDLKVAALLHSCKGRAHKCSSLLLYGKNLHFSSIKC